MAPAGHEGRQGEPPGGRGLPPGLQPVGHRGEDREEGGAGADHGGEKEVYGGPELLGDEHEHVEVEHT